MIVLPAPDEHSARVLRSYVAQRALAERGAPMEAAIARGMADSLAKRFGIVELAARAYVPDPCAAHVAYDGITLMVTDVPWWRGMLAVAVLDRVGALQDEHFELSDADSPWEFDPNAGEIGDFVIRVVGFQRIIMLAAGIIAAVTFRLSCIDALRRLRRKDSKLKVLPVPGLSPWLREYAPWRTDAQKPRDTPEDSLAWFLGGISGVMRALNSERIRMATRRRGMIPRNALVRWKPPDALFCPDAGEIDMHAPDAHDANKAPPREPAIIGAVTSARKRGEDAEMNGRTNLFKAGAKDGMETALRMLRWFDQ